MKVCSCCGGEKPLVDFNFKNKAKGLYQARCRLCMKSCKREHYQKNKQRYLENKNRRIEENKAWYKEYKSKLSCSECGFNNPKALQFHHTDDNKEGNIGEMIHNGNSIDKVITEINKCVVLCANCHMVHHANERGEP